MLIDPERVGSGDERRFEDEQQQERRFAAEHPVGSRVEVLYEVESGQAEGEVAELGYARSGGSPVITAVAGLAAALCVAGTFFAFRATGRLSRRGDGSSAGASTAPRR